MIVAIVDAVGAGAIVHFCLTAPELDIRTVTVVGARLVTVEDVVVAARLEGQNVFLARTSEAARAVVKLPQVQAATISVMPPSSASIEVLERVPRLIWRTGRSDLLVDAGGLILGPNDGAELPVVQDLSNATLPVSTRLDADLVATALELAELVPLELPGEPIAITYSAEEGLGLTAPGTPPSWRAALGSDGKVNSKLMALKATLGALDAKPIVLAPTAGATPTPSPAPTPGRSPAAVAPRATTKIPTVIDLRFHDRAYLR